MLKRRRNLTHFPFFLIQLPKSAPSNDYEIARISDAAPKCTNTSTTADIHHLKIDAPRAAADVRKQIDQRAHHFDHDRVCRTTSLRPSRCHPSAVAYTGASVHCAG